MNNTIQLVDASLRDGGHRTNFHFQDSDLKAILSSLDHSGIECIEIGYRNCSLSPTGNLGRAGYCAKDYLLQCRSFVKNADLAVMIYSKNIRPEDLVELKNCGVSLLRICIAQNELTSALPIIEMARKSGLKSSVNFTHISYYDWSELDKVIEQASQSGTDIIYFAHSDGSVLPDHIRDLYERYTKLYTIPFGFHAHDNLGLAQANSIAAMESGACFIDSTLAGMGKGIGNLKTEFFTAYLHAIHIKKYDLSAVLEAANYVRNALKIGHEAVEWDDIIRGVTDLSEARLQMYKEKK